MSNHIRRRRIDKTVAAGAFIVATVFALAAVAACGDDGKPSPATTVTVTATPTAKASATKAPTTKPSATMTLTATKQLAIAAASGPKANAVSVVSSTGAVKQLVPPKSGPITSLAWSPDAARLGYVQYKSMMSGDCVVLVYDLATNETAVVSVGGATPASVAGFAWVGPKQMIVAALKGSGPTWKANATLYRCDVAAGTSTVVKDSDGTTLKGVWPSATADAATVAFVRFGKPSGYDQAQDLMLLDADTLAVKKLAHGTIASDHDSNAFGLPRISPDGTYVYTIAHGSDIGFSCTVYKTSGGKAFQGGQMVYPTDGSWDPNSGRLAFGGASGVDGGLSDGLNVWTPGASSATSILTYKKIFTPSLAWTPKGKQIVYAKSKSYPAHSDLWVVNADGSNPHLLMKNGAEPACAEAPVAF